MGHAPPGKEVGIEAQGQTRKRNSDRAGGSSAFEGDGAVVGLRYVSFKTNIRMAKRKAKEGQGKLF